MTGRERRERDPFWLQEVKARLARIRVARAIRETQEVQRRWDDSENVIEALLLRRRLAGGRDARCDDA